MTMLYHYETEKINQAVKRHVFRKFLLDDEFSNLRSQFVTLNRQPNQRDLARKYLLNKVLQC